MHCVQTATAVAPSAVEYVPLPQRLLHDALPMQEEYAPAMHCVQTAIEIAPIVVEYVPL